jgi:hypothetical protein
MTPIAGLEVEEQVATYINYISRIYARNRDDREENQQEVVLKILQLQKKGITNPGSQMLAIKNTMRSRSRKARTVEKIVNDMGRVIVRSTPVVWNQSRIDEACEQLPTLQAEILRNLTNPSERYRDALIEKYKGKDYIHLDESVLAEVLNVSPATLSRHKQQMLITSLKLFGPVAV